MRGRYRADRVGGGVVGSTHADGEDVSAFTTAARAVAWRNIHNWFTNPALVLPSLLFPLFFFTAFAGGLSRVDSVPGFDYEAGYTTFVYGFVLLQAATFGGIFTGFSVALDFESGFARRLMLGATNRGGIVAGYWLSALIRAVFTITVITLVALVAGLEVHGNGIDVVGLYTLALLMNAFAVLFGTGVAMRLRTMQAGPAIQTPAFLLLFLAPVWVPYDLLTGWVQAAASVNPVTLVLEAGRGFLVGDPIKVLPAFAVIAVLVALTTLWARGGLRSAEKVA
jgi:ABC-2 type transport system permease protein